MRYVAAALLALATILSASFLFCGVANSEEKVSESTGFEATMAAIDAVLEHQEKCRLHWSLSDIPNADKAALRHGETELRKLLADRPILARHIQPGDTLWRWIAFLFGGGGTECRVYWNGQSAFTAAGARAATFHGLTPQMSMIYVDANSNGEELTHDQIWVAVVFELHNAILNGPLCRDLMEQARSRRIGKTDYVKANCSSEFNSICGSRLFYRHIFLPWCEQAAVATDPGIWRFGEPLTLQEWLANLKNSSGYPWDPYGHHYDDLVVDWFMQRQDFEAARVYLEENDHAEITEWRKLLWLKRTAICSVECGLTTRAIGCADRALEYKMRDDLRAPFLCLKARAYERERKYRDALRFSAMVLLSDKEDSVELDARLLRIRIFVSQHDWNSAERSCRQFIRRFPHSHEAIQVREYIRTAEKQLAETEGRDS